MTTQYKGGRDYFWNYQGKGPEKPPQWYPEAACRGVDPNLFYPSRGDFHTMRQALAICATCPVRSECLDFAVTYFEEHGVWGGVSERGRRPLYAKRRHGPHPQKVSPQP